MDTDMSISYITEPCEKVRLKMDTYEKYVIQECLMEEREIKHQSIHRL